MSYIPSLIIYALMAAGGWMVFVKAGLPGWGAIIPIYNLYLMTKMAGKPAWWIIIGLIPIVNILLMIPIAEGFGKSTGFAVGMGLLPPIFWPILGFGDAEWQGEPVAV